MDKVGTQGDQYESKVFDEDDEKTKGMEAVNKKCEVCCAECGEGMK